MKAVVVLLVLFGFEAAAAPGLKHVMLVTKLAAGGLGILGASAAIAVLVAARRRGVRRLPA